MAFVLLSSNELQVRTCANEAMNKKGDKESWEDEEDPACKLSCYQYTGQARQVLLPFSYISCMPIKLGLDRKVHSTWHRYKHDQACRRSLAVRRMLITCTLA